MLELFCILKNVVFCRFWFYYWFNWQTSATFRIIFALLFSSMQLVEYYLWTNLNTNEVGEDKNKFYSKIGYTVILLEPLFALFMVYSLKIYGLPITKFLIIFYIIYISIYTKMNYNKLNFITRIGDNGHLEWYFLKNNGLLHYLIWFFIFFY